MRSLPFVLLLACTHGATDAVDTDPPAEDTPVDLPADHDLGPVTAGVAALPDFPQDTDPPAPAGPLRPSDCFGAQWGASPPVDYDVYAPTMGSHCLGTNHQDIQGVQRVVFVGDSVTAGTLPTPTGQWWRNRLADRLARDFGLEAPGFRWRNMDPISGDALEMASGDFATCAKYGARTDDLLMDPHRQLETCIPEDQRDKTTLIVLTIGGNDIYALLEDVRAGVDETTLRDTYTRATGLFREAVDWIQEPGRFPNGVYVIFATTYDFTDHDGAMDMASCDGAQLINMDAPLMEPITWDILGEAQETYVRTAVETGTDLIFMGEAFCGHGWDAGNPASRCYRPAGGVWTDLTCEHPNAAGHDAIFDMFMAVIRE